MKYFMFRDLDHQSNLLNNKAYHAAGIVEKIYNTIEKTDLNKDVAVCFLNPFTGEVISAWRGHQEIEIFECDEFEWKYVSKQLSMLR
jgi:hypothetical protein